MIKAANVYFNRAIADFFLAISCSRLGGSCDRRRLTYGVDLDSIPARTGATKTARPPTLALISSSVGGAAPRAPALDRAALAAGV
jgi:hypothetical protein